MNLNNWVFQFDYEISYHTNVKLLFFNELFLLENKHPNERF